MGRPPPADLAGAGPPIAFTHIGLSIVLYPVAGLAIAWLALTYGHTLGGTRRGVAAIGVAAGLGHALSVPLTLVLPDAELSPVFAGSAVLIALWSLTTGLAGVGGPRSTPAPRSQRTLVA